MITLEDKLNKLREEYITASPSMRLIIKSKAETLKKEIAAKKKNDDLDAKIKHAQQTLLEYAEAKKRGVKAPWNTPKLIPDA